MQATSQIALRPAACRTPRRPHRTVQPVRALLGATEYASQAAGLAATLGAAGGALPLLAGGLAAAGLASLVPPPPPGLRQPVSVNLEGGKAPLNTHGVGRGGKHPPFPGRIVSIERMGGRDAERDVTNLVIDTGVS